MPLWVHQRAERLREKNPDMKEETAWAVATQQGRAVGKVPKSYGTSKGRSDARRLYRKPKSEYQKQASLEIASEARRRLVRILLSQS